MNFNFSMNSSFSNQKREKQKLSAQEEYWLDRILRDHSTQIFVIIVLFFGLIFASIVYGIYNPSPTNTSNAGSNRIEINGSKIIISQ